jgi:hypothetical protein
LTRSECRGSTVCRKVQPVGLRRGGGALCFAVDTRFVGIDLGREPVPERPRRAEAAHERTTWMVVDEASERRHLASRSMIVAVAPHTAGALARHGRCQSRDTAGLEINLAIPPFS